MNTQNKTTNESIYQTIYSNIFHQLGGNKFVAMTGATLFSDKNSIIVKFKGCKEMNHLKIEYIVSSDLYELTFGKVTPSNYLPKKTYSFVYGDMLQNVFTKETGLQTHL